MVIFHCYVSLPEGILSFFDMAMSFIDAEGESLMFDPTAATPEQSKHLETMVGWHPHDIKSYQ